MYSHYLKFEKVLAKIELFFVVIPFILIFITVVGQVFQRYFNLPIADTSELSMICMAVFTFMSMGYLVFNEGHITIEVHKLIKNHKALAIVEIVMYVVMIVFSLFYLYLGYDLFSFALSTGTATTQLRIPLSIPYGTMLVGFVCVIIHALGKILERWTFRNDLGELYDKEINIEELR